jgi:hypothetical protein
LIRCRQCLREVVDRALVCPDCGAPIGTLGCLPLAGWLVLGSMYLALPLAFFAPSVLFLGAALFVLAALWLLTVAAGRLTGKVEMTPTLWFLGIMLAAMLVVFAGAAVWLEGFHR